MLVAKQVADLLTWLRAMIAFVFIWLGVSQGEFGLHVAIWMMIASWTTDILDGPLARMSLVSYQTWIGDYDLQVDIAVSVGLLGYLVMAGFASSLVGVTYIVFWAMFFLRKGIPRSLGMLVQAPVYIWFIWISLRDLPEEGVWMLLWIATAVIATWPRFFTEVIPGFIDGFVDVLKMLKVSQEP
jgi:phosphatidylglycerophosphate synthase